MYSRIEYGGIIRNLEWTNRDIKLKLNDHIEGHMGTIETEKAQSYFKELLNSQGWSLSKFAIEHHIATTEIDNDKERNTYIEKIKKQISRKSTKLELINSYISFLQNHYDFNKTIHIVPKNYSSGKFDVMLEKGLAEISEVATKLVTKQC